MTSLVEDTVENLSFIYDKSPGIKIEIEMN